MPKPDSWDEVERTTARLERWLWATAALLLTGAGAAVVLSTGVGGPTRVALITVVFISIGAALPVGLMFEWARWRNMRTIRRFRQARAARLSKRHDTTTQHD